MWYRTGTISLTKDSAIITGKDTKWAQAVNGVMAAMILIAPDGKFYEIKNVVSDTSLVLTTNYSGATAANQKYEVITTYQGDITQFAARFTAILSAMGLSRADMYNWLTSTAATINIAKDDGTTVPVKTLKAFSDEQAAFAKKGTNSDITSITGLTTALSIAQGGTGATTAAELRKNAGLKEAATRDVGTSTGNVMAVGAFGIGGSGESRLSLASNLGLFQYLLNKGGCIFSMAGNGGGSTLSQYAPSIFMRAGDAMSILSTDHRTGIIKVMGASEEWVTSGGVSGYFKENTLYGISNTTKASDGTIKAASPIVKLFNDGKAETNDESEGCVVERLGVGKYLITGCMGLNADAGWNGIDGGFDIPCDRHKRPRVWLDYEVNADGSILVKTYHCTYPDSPEFAQNRIGYKDENGVFIETVKSGEPVDIPADQYLLVRVEMPENSVWNQRIVAMQADFPEE